jgi:hypothetical protein
VLSPFLCSVMRIMRRGGNMGVDWERVAEALFDAREEYKYKRWRDLTEAERWRWVYAAKETVKAWAGVQY